MSNAENHFHLTVALHHMRAINPDLLPVEKVEPYGMAMRHLERMNNERTRTRSETSGG